MRNIFLALSLLITTIVLANDGAYYASGNHLIPIEDGDISVKKEVLDIVRKGEFIYVTVDYTFYNHSADKSILVGFEAPSPSGDVDGYPVKGGHPFIHDFKVVMNGKNLKYKKAIVTEEHYFQDGKIRARKESEVLDEHFNPNEPDFYYVYYFDAKFKKGENKIIHTYRFDVSGSVITKYDFDYILTAVNRWKNKGIEDFTLNIDMGNQTYFTIENTFCKSGDWIIEDGRSMAFSEYTNFTINSGKITFHKKNFSPKGELQLSSPSFGVWGVFEVFDSSKDSLPPYIDSYEGEYNVSTRAIDDKSYMILRNLPFAIKGYVFKTKYIQDYYLKQMWYFPNPDYTTTDLEGVYLEWYNEVLKNQQ